MEYFVRRGEQQFGPYTLAEMQEYAQTGRIVGSDFAKSEGLADWVPVSQILGNIPMQVAAPAVAVPAPIEAIPLPPNLHWVVLLFVLIFGLFFGALAVLQKSVAILDQRQRKLLPGEFVVGIGR